MDQSRNDMLSEVAYKSYPGWRSFIEPIVNQCNQDGATILQIKEKFGSLRFYVSGCTDAIDELIRVGETQSETTCPTCGVTDQMISNQNGYWTTRCDICRKAAL